MNLGAKKKQIAEANTLLALLSDPSGAQKFLDEITAAIRKHEDSLKEAQIASAEVTRRIKEVSEREAWAKEYIASIQNKGDDLETRELWLADEKAKFSREAGEVLIQEKERSESLDRRDEDITAREEVIARNEAQAVTHLNDGKALEKHWLDKMARFNALAKE